MSEMMMGGDVGALAAALAKAQAKMGHAAKNGTNPHFRSEYSTLVDLHNAAYPHLSANGLSVVQVGIPNGIRTILLHAGGGWIAGDMTAEGRDASPQSIGSVYTYLRRYGFAAAAGVSSGEDDDGEAAQPQKLPDKRPDPIDALAYESRRDQREPSAPAPDWATDKQVGFAKKLLQSSAFTDADRKAWGAKFKTATRKEASALIEDIQAEIKAYENGPSQEEML